MPEHKYAAILRAIADGKTVQWENPVGVWRDQAPATVLYVATLGSSEPHQFRVKPETILINGHEVPKPMTEAPQTGETCYTPSLMQERASMVWNWFGEEHQYRRLARGVVHATAEAAEAHTKALLSFTEQPCQN